MRVTSALVPAAARLSTPDSYSNPRQLIHVNGTPVIIHLLKGLQSVGILRVVVTLGHNATKLERAVRAEHFGPMRIEFVLCHSWKRGHASNIMSSRSIFHPDEPLLVVMSDHLFDARLMKQMVDVQMPPEVDAVALVDDSQEIVEWACGAHCDEHCKGGHCQVLVKVLRGHDGLVADIGPRLGLFDGLEAGMYVAKSRMFDVLHELLATSIYCQLADAMQVLAKRGRLRYVSTQSVPGAGWYSELTVCSLPEVARLSSRAVKPEWRLAAAELLRTCPTVTPALTQAQTQVPGRPSLESESVLYELGRCIGEGSFSIVVEAEAHGWARRPKRPMSAALALPGGSGASQRWSSSASNLAVKVVRKGQEGSDDMERQIMWEVHVLQQLRHEHIVRVMDVIDVVDATYIVMEQIEGPELLHYIAAQPLRRLSPDTTCRFFCHLLAALQHAHQRGIVHCDVKPENIRLNKQCDSAVLTDFGLALMPGVCDDPLLRGTPWYSAPEQLTGYDATTICGKRCISPAIDIWSLGVTLYEMLCGKVPFTGKDQRELVRNVLGLEYTFPAHVAAEQRAVVESMLRVAPCDRACLDELIACSWASHSGYLPADALPFQCMPCDESTVIRWAPRSGSSLPSRLGLLLGLVYLSFCAAALWLHGASSLARLALEVD